MHNLALISSPFDQDPQYTGSLGHLAELGAWLEPNQDGTLTLVAQVGIGAPIQIYNEDRSVRFWLGIRSARLQIIGQPRSGYQIRTWHHGIANIVTLITRPKGGRAHWQIDQCPTQGPIRFPTLTVHDDGSKIKAMSYSGLHIRLACSREDISISDLELQTDSGWQRAERIAHRNAIIAAEAYIRTALFHELRSERRDADDRHADVPILAVKVGKISLAKQCSGSEIRNPFALQLTSKIADILQSTQRHIFHLAGYSGITSNSYYVGTNLSGTDLRNHDIYFANLPNLDTATVLWDHTSNLPQARDFPQSRISAFFLSQSGILPHWNSSVSRLRLDLKGASFDINRLTGLHVLNDLEIAASKIVNTNQLVQLRILKYLYFISCRIENHEKIADLETIEHLGLPGSDIDHLNALSKMRSLVWLNLNFTPIVDFAPLEQLTSLIRLEVVNCKLHDLQALRGLTRLRTLNLHGIPATDLTPLTPLQELRVLDIANTAIEDLSPMLDLPHLERIMVASEARRARLAETLGEKGHLVKVYWH